MKARAVRNVNEQVYRRLQEMARENKRSLQAQRRLIPERAVQFAEGSPLHQAQEWRRRLADRPWGNIADDIRRERAR